MIPEILVYIAIFWLRTFSSYKEPVENYWQSMRTYINLQIYIISAFFYQKPIVLVLIFHSSSLFVCFVLFSSWSMLFLWGAALVGIM